MKLRNYQQKLVNDVRQRILDGYRRILIQLPTGGGKTAVASYIIQQAIRKGNRAMMTVHRSELAEQTAETMEKFNVPYGLIQAGESMDLSKPMQVASILTLRNRLDKIPVPSVLVVDESQHIISKTWRDVADYYSQNGSIILGLSATPKRLSGESLGQCFDVMVQGPSIAELISVGALSSYRYFAPSVGINTETIKIKCGDFDKSELEIVINKNAITGNAVEHYKRIIPGKRAIAFCVSVNHAKSVAQQFSQSGIPSEFVDGSMSKEARKATFTRFRNGETLVLTNVEIAGEGVDIPAVEAVILLRPTMSESLYLQQVGRALRPDPVNIFKIAVVLDHVGNVHRHGLPDATREWTLEGAVKRRRGETGGVGVRICPACYMCHSPAPVCPFCGYEYHLTARQIAEEAGTLEEYDAEQAAFQKRRDRIELNQCATLDDLKAYAAAHNYAPGWVRIRARLKNIRS